MLEAIFGFGGTRQPLKPNAYSVSQKPRAMPQPNVGHLLLLDERRRLEVVGRHHRDQRQHAFLLDETTRLGEVRVGLLLSSPQPT